ncbi:CLUMA_CG000956, isoform A [Clunio marinus]|uniref:CLUMA_CG000956, isoform A n=1 Tax=Clunio marinus TaxID=568069 RepID=A0A1J1HHW7_9DIPT|nr:CLUMA_CG000956, isoform A [Clunio marinus]
MMKEEHFFGSRASCKERATVKCKVEDETSAVHKLSAINFLKTFHCLCAHSTLLLVRNHKKKRKLKYNSTLTGVNYWLYQFQMTINIVMNYTLKSHKYIANKNSSI